MRFDREALRDLHCWVAERDQDPAAQRDELLELLQALIAGESIEVTDPPAPGQERLELLADPHEHECDCECEACEGLRCKWCGLLHDGPADFCAQALIEYRRTSLQLEALGLG